MCHVNEYIIFNLSFSTLPILIIGSTFDSGLNGASFTSLFPLAGSFLSTSGHFLGDTPVIPPIPPPILPSTVQQQSTTATTTTNVTSSSAASSLLSSTGSGSPVVVPTSVGDSTVKTTATSHGNNNMESVSGD